MHRQSTAMLLWTLCSLLFALPFPARAQSLTAFSYSGSLIINKVPANGTYDFRFTLYTASSGGSAVGSPVIVSAVTVSSGSYTVTLDFGSTSFAGAPLYMQIDYRLSGTTTFTKISGRALETTRFALLSSNALLSLLSNNTLEIGGNPVSSAAPSSGQSLVWSGTVWAPATVGSGNTYSAGAGLALTGDVFSIANGGVVAAMLAAGAVTTPAIADGAVTSSKLNWPLSESLNSGSALLSLTNTGSGDGVDGNSNSGYGVYGSSSSNNGVNGLSNSGNGVEGASFGGYGVYGLSSGANAAGYFKNTGSGDGVDGYSSSGYGVYGESSGVNAAGYFKNTGSGSGAACLASSSSNSLSYGVLGYNPGSGYGVEGVSISGPGVYGQSAGSFAAGYFADSSSGTGVYGSSNDGAGVEGDSNNGYGVYGISSSSYAGYFLGNLQVTGAITAGVKDFKIDHPLDPANKYLLHSCVESDQMTNLYSGNVILNAAGQAIVELPDWFEALNTDFRYQLTCIGGFAPVYIAQEIRNHQFQIAGGSPGLKVSWQVTGVRQDAYAKAHPLIVEQEKPEKERGKFLHPVEEGFDETLGIDYEKRHRPR